VRLVYEVYLVNELKILIYLKRIHTDDDGVWNIHTESTVHQGSKDDYACIFRVVLRDK
jgi:hypothetical protein